METNGKPAVLRRVELYLSESDVELIRKRTNKLNCDCNDFLSDIITKYLAGAFVDRNEVVTLTSIGQPEVSLARENQQQTETTQNLPTQLENRQILPLC